MATDVQTSAAAVLERACKTLALGSAALRDLPNRLARAVNHGAAYQSPDDVRGPAARAMGVGIYRVLSSFRALHPNFAQCPN